MKISIALFGNRCSWTSSGRHALTEKDRALCFFLLDCNGQTCIYRLVWGPTEVRFRRNRDFPTDDDNCAPWWAYVILKRSPPKLQNLKVVVGVGHQQDQLFPSGLTNCRKTQLSSSLGGLVRSAGKYWGSLVLHFLVISCCSGVQ